MSRVLFQRFVLILLSTLLFASAVHANEPFTLNNDSTKIDLNKDQKAIFVSRQAAHLPEQELTDSAKVESWINSLDSARAFKLDATLNLKWLTVENQSDTTRWILRLGDTNIEDAIVQVYDPGTGQRLAKIKTGSTHIAMDEIPDLHHGVELNIPKGESRQILIMISNSFFSGEPLLEISTPTVYHKTVNNNNFVIFISFGIILGLSITALIQCTLLAEAKYFWYSMYLFFYTLGMAVYHNIFSHFFGITYISIHYIYLFYGSAFCFILFFSHFLELSKNHAKINHLVSILKALMILGFLTSPLTPADAANTTFMVISCLTITSLYFISIFALFKHELVARFLMVGITVQLSAYTYSFLHINGIIHVWNEVQVVVLACIAFDAILFSIALADRVRILKDAQTELSLQSTTDELTGLLNRRGYEAQLNTLLDQNIAVDIVFIDLDNLKFINDEHGHDEGDRLLVNVANDLQYCFTECLCLARLGGDEFVMLLPKTHTDVHDQFYRINENLSESWGHKTAVSYGISACLSKEEVSDAMRAADMAMYRNKIERKSSGKETTRQSITE